VEFINDQPNNLTRRKKYQKELTHCFSILPLILPSTVNYSNLSSRQSLFASYLPPSITQTFLQGSLCLHLTFHRQLLKPFFKAVSLCILPSTVNYSNLSSRQSLFAPSIAQRNFCLPQRTNKKSYLPMHSLQQLWTYSRRKHTKN
jgi:hypothetical protein